MPQSDNVMRGKVLSASTLAGFRVRSDRNEDLGTIEELMVEPASGKVAFAILCFGGIIGPGDKLFVVPWSLLRLDSDNRVLVLNADRSLIERAPAFHQDEWPDFADERWARELDTYYGPAALAAA